MQKIDSIIFDLGNVVLPLQDMDLWHSKVKSLFIKPEEYEKLVQKNFFSDFEKGLIDSEKFLEVLERNTDSKYSSEHIIDVWNFILGDLPDTRVDFLLRLKKKYQLFLLSNTNSIHIDYLLKDIHKKYGRNILEEIFDVCYYSYEIKMLKPDAEIYQYVLNEQKLKPENTLFLDDRADNIAGASVLGIQTILVNLNADIADLLSDF